MAAQTEKRRAVHTDQAEGGCSNENFDLETGS